MHRRHFLAALAALGFSPRFTAQAATTLAIHYRKPNPYAPQLQKIDPAQDVFLCEQQAPLREQAALARLTASHSAQPRAEPIRKVRVDALADNQIRYELTTATTHTVGTLHLGTDAPPSATTAHSPEPYFRDVTAHVFRHTPSFYQQLAIGNPQWRATLDPALGLDIYASNGISAADIDHCGRDEIYVCQQGGLPNRLYKFNPDHSLEDITERANLGILDDTTCALFADFRNSGHQDLVLLRGSGPLLFLNDGTGKFQLAPDAFHFQTPAQGSFTGMAAADYDRDGKLDLYLCCYVYFQSEDQYRYPAPYHDAQNGPPNFLFRNELAPDGSGVFTDVTEAAGLNHNNNRYSFAPAWCDFDGDGWPDLYVANDFGRNNLYRNRNGHFRDEAATLGVEDLGPGMSASWFDYDGDGRPDLYVSNMWSAPGQRITHDPAFPKSLPLAHYQRHAKGNTLFRNTASGSFEETSVAQNVEMGRWAWSSGGFDFNNDGHPEVFIAAGMLSSGTPDPSTPDLNSFFWRQVVAQSPPDAHSAPAYENGWNAINQLIREGKNWCGAESNVFYVRPPGAKAFEDHSGISGLDFADDSRAFAVTDIDGDGNLDIVLKSRLAPQVRVLQNNSTHGRRALGIQLTGTQSNRDAIGARVEVAGQVQFVTAGSGYLSQHTKTLYFAMGDRDSVDARITWPSGIVQTCADLGVGVHHCAENGPMLRSNPLGTPEPWPTPPVSANNTPAFTQTWFLDPVPLPDRRPPGFLLLHSGDLPAFPAGLPTTPVDLSKDPDLAAAYAIFRRYLFDLRTDLTTPALFLVDDQSRARKFYASIPDADTLHADLASPGHPLPFPGRYYQQPARNFYKLGAAFYQAGYPDQAIPYLVETTRRNPDNAKAWMALGELHSQAARSAEARAAFEHALAAKNPNPDAANELGLLAAQANQPVEAQRYFEQAISLRRDHSSAINNLAVLFMKQGKSNDAIAALRYGITVAPDDEQLYMNLGRIYVASGDRERARAVMQQLLERKPDDPTALHALTELNAR